MEAGDFQRRSSNNSFQESASLVSVTANYNWSAVDLLSGESTEKSVKQVSELLVFTTRKIRLTRLGLNKKIGAQLNYR